MTVFADGPAPGVVTESREDNNIGSSTPNQIIITVPSYTITTSAGSGGSISPSGSFTKSAGSSQAFTASPNANHVVNQWLVDGGVVQNGGTGYTLSNIQANRSVQVTFTFVIPETRIGIASLDGGQFHVSVATVIGANYTLEFKNSLADPNWATVQTLPGTGGTVTLTDSAVTDSTRFYHIRAQ